jgi:hypothetical protein
MSWAPPSKRNQPRITRPSLGAVSAGCGAIMGGQGR